MTYLAAQVERLRNLGLTVETAVRLGHPTEAIFEYVLARRVELVMLATHGRSGLAR